MKKRIQTGFTLYELLITVLIAAVILAFGVPNMNAFRQNSTMISAANDLHSSFHLARSEASRARGIVTICASTNSAATPPTCGGEFEDGWIVFADTDGDIVVDNGESIIRRFPAVDDDIVISNADNDYFSFAASGQGRGTVGSNGTPVSTLILCDGRGNIIGPGGRSTARVLVVTPLGRATVLSDKTQVAAKGGC